MVAIAEERELITAGTGPVADIEKHGMTGRGTYGSTMAHTCAGVCAPWSRARMTFRSFSARKPGMDGSDLRSWKQPGSGLGDPGEPASCSRARRGRDDDA